jgi:hypothetical protein
VWARRGDGTLFYLNHGAVDDDVLAAAHAGQLICPYPGCPDPRFIARGGSERRHHFAQQGRRSGAPNHSGLAPSGALDADRLDHRSLPAPPAHARR